MATAGKTRLGVVARFLDDARAAGRREGISLPRMYLEALALRLPPCSLGLSEYFDYRLYERRLSWDEKRQFVGWRGEEALDRCNDRSCHIYADDKRALASLLAEAGLPHPRIAAVYQNDVPSNLAATSLRRPEELVEWLRECDEFPLFAKPVHAGFGRGAFLIQGLDREKQSLVFGPKGESRPLEEWAAGLSNPEGLGYLFQKVVAPHGKLAELQSKRLSSLRVMVLQAKGTAPCIYRAVWKIPREFNIIDNFESGTLGNLLAAVDIETGRVLRVVRGYGLSLEELDHHPDSGLAFGNLVLPDWSELKAAVLNAAGLLPGFGFQHWDVALSDQGPVLLEVNLFSAGGTELSQLVEGRGLLEPRLLACNGLL